MFSINESMASPLNGTQVKVLVILFFICEEKKGSEEVPNERPSEVI